MRRPRCSFSIGLFGKLHILVVADGHRDRTVRRRDPRRRWRHRRRRVSTRPRLSRLLASGHRSRCATLATTSLARSDSCRPAGERHITISPTTATGSSHQRSLKTPRAFPHDRPGNENAAHFAGAPEDVSANTRTGGLSDRPIEVQWPSGRSDGQRSGVVATRLPPRPAAPTAPISQPCVAFLRGDPLARPRMALAASFTREPCRPASCTSVSHAASPSHPRLPSHGHRACYRLWRRDAFRASANTHGFARAHCHAFVNTHARRLCRGV